MAMGEKDGRVGKWKAEAWRGEGRRNGEGGQANRARRRRSEPSSPHGSVLSGNGRCAMGHVPLARGVSPLTI
eukprot:scaffold48104_cov38-Tisochrysis_lutea.AAC.4